MPSFVCFHGTQEMFDAFKTPAWFSNTFEYAENFASHWGQIGARTDSSRVVVVEVEIKNPYYTSDWCVTEPQSGDLLKKIQLAGHDGVVFTSPENDQEIEYIAFKSDQIRQIKSVSVAEVCGNLPRQDSGSFPQMG